MNDGLQAWQSHFNLTKCSVHRGLVGASAPIKLGMVGFIVFHPPLLTELRAEFTPQGFMHKVGWVQQSVTHQKQIALTKLRADALSYPRDNVANRHL